MNKAVIATLIALITIVGAVLGYSNQFVSKGQFDEFKVGTVQNLDKRLDRMEEKLDRISDRLK